MLFPFFAHALSYYLCVLWIVHPLNDSEAVDRYIPVRLLYESLNFALYVLYLQLSREIFMH
jgi:hypothetical protein